MSSPAHWQRQLRRTGVVYSLAQARVCPGRAPGFRARVVPPTRRLTGPHIDRHQQTVYEEN